MENRSSHFLVGLFVLAGVLLLSGFATWISLKNSSFESRQVDILFEGTVAGLQIGSRVQYSGIPIGRVTDIRFDPEDYETIIATAEITQSAPVKKDTRARLEFQGVTGIAFIDLYGSNLDGEELDFSNRSQKPFIKGDPSVLAQITHSVPDAINGATVALEGVTQLLSDQNIERYDEIIANLAVMLAALNEELPKITELMSVASKAGTTIDGTAGEVQEILASLNHNLDDIGSRSDELVSTGLEATRQINDTTQSLQSLIWRFDRMLADLERPVEDFAQSGLYDFTEMVRETRLLVASLTRISTEFERDPAGFLIGGNKRGFTPE